MPWSSNQGGGSGGGGGGWKGGGGGGPWGQGPSGPGGQPPNIEDVIKRSQDRVKQVMGGGGFPGWLAFLAAAAGFLAFTFYALTFQVNPDEQGIVLRFGQYIRSEPPGLHFRLPYPIEEVYKPQVTQQKIVQVGMRTEAGTYRGNQRYAPSGPARNVPEESLMLTADENIVDVEFVAMWFIDAAEKYLFNIADPDQTVKDVAESAMREVIGRSKVSDILAPGREPVEVAVKALMQQILDSYGAGVKIAQVKIQQAQAPAQVRDAFNDVVSAIQDRDRVQNEARGYSNKVIPEARGEAQRILQAAQAYKEQSIAEATGSTARFISVYEQYKKAPEVTRKRMFLETMEQVLGGSDKIIIDGKAGQGVVPYLPLDQLSKKPKTGEGN
jgi:modulator of FtsH protease HflK